MIYKKLLLTCLLTLQAGLVCAQDNPMDTDISNNQSINRMIAHQRQIAEKAKKGTSSLRKEIREPVQSAQDFIKAKNYGSALAEVAKTDTIADKKNEEIELIESTRGTAAMGLNQVPVATKSLNTLLALPQITAAEKPLIAETAIGFLFQNKAYSEAANWIERYFEVGGTKEDIRPLLPQALYLSQQYDKVSKPLLPLIEADEKAGKTPDKSYLEMLASSYLQTKDEAGYVASLEKLLAYYPTSAYWQDRLARTVNKESFDDRLRLDAFALQIVTNTMSDEDYYYMAEQALQQGYAGYAKKILAQGKAAGLIGVGQFAADHNKLIAEVDKEVAKDQKALAQNEAQAMKAADGNRLYRVGYHYVAMGQTEKGLGLMEQGLKKGNLKSPTEAMLRLATSYVQTGNQARASELLGQIKSTDGGADLAHLWQIYLKAQPAKPTVS